MGLVTEGLTYRRSDSPPIGATTEPSAIVGLTANIDQSTIVDLYGFINRLLLLADLLGPKFSITTQVIAINLSVDFSLVIQGYEALDPASGEAADTVFSVPLFERALARVVLDLSKENDEKGGDKVRLSPAVFAAAGNRAGDRVRVRLGYPATRPETIAVSLVQSGPSPEAVEPLEWVDIPAAAGLKPCFAIDVGKMSLSARHGSSFASAWLSGHYGLLAIQSADVQLMGMLSKVAWLMQWTERRRLPSGRQRLPCFVAVLQGERTQPRSSGEMDELIVRLWKEFKADFCMHGSSAAVGEWLRLNKCQLSDIDPVIKKDLGDVDLIFVGTIANGSEADVKDFARNWFRERVGRSWIADRKRPIQLHPYEGFVSGGARLRSVTPANHLYLTRGGLIDTWGDWRIWSAAERSGSFQ
jgi:hypothetical protein